MGYKIELDLWYAIVSQACQRKVALYKTHTAQPKEGIRRKSYDYEVVGKIITHLDQ